MLQQVVLGECASLLEVLEIFEIASLAPSIRSLLYTTLLSNVSKQSGVV